MTSCYVGYGNGYGYAHGSLHAVTPIIQWRAASEFEADNAAENNLLGTELTTKPKCVRGINKFVGLLPYVLLLKVCVMRATSTSMYKSLCYGYL